jgi:aminotransferase MxcL
MPKPNRSISLPWCGTFSRDHRMWGGDGFQPRAIRKGKGARVIGSDGKEYLDWVSGLGGNLLGHENKEFTKFMGIHLHKGVSFSIQSKLEEEVAQLLCMEVAPRIPGFGPGTTGVRFGLSGSDVCDMAVRLSRAVTGKKTIVSMGYHGWGDAFVVATPPALGILPEIAKYTLDVPFGDREALDKAVTGRENDIAAVILEHPAIDPDDTYYIFLRHWCNEHRAIMVMDEVVTGLRYGVGGACEKYTITPDLVCYGKGFGNGIPVSVLMGYKDLMSWFARESPVFCSSTHFGNSFSLAAVKCVLGIWNDDCVDQISAVGERLMTGLVNIGWNVIGHPVRSVVVHPNDYERAYFISGMRDNGILMNRPNFPTLAHTYTDVDYTLSAAETVYENMRKLSPDALKVATENYMPRVLFRNR